MTPLLAQRSRPDRSFERLYRRHVGDVYRYALAVLRNPADAEDVTQTTFLNAYRAYERGQRPEAPHNWLIAIAHNVCRQRFRQSARRPQEVAFGAEVADRIDDDDQTPSAEDIRRALGHLAFNQRAALVMRELEGRSYQEIGEILNVSVSAVETLIFRARRALREQLEGSLTCGEAEFAISRQLDGRLSRAEKGQLRGHLRECHDCATFARRQRAQRAALRSIGAVPLPSSLASFFGGGGGATLLGGAAAKVAAVTAAGALVAGGGYEASTHVARHPAPQHTASTVRLRSRPPAVLPEPPAAHPARIASVFPGAKKHRKAAAKAPAAAKATILAPAQEAARPNRPAQAQGPKRAARAVRPGRAEAHPRGRGNGRGGGSAHGKANGNGNGHGKGNGPELSPRPATHGVTVALPTVTVPVPEPPDVPPNPLPEPPHK